MGNTCQALSIVQRQTTNIRSLTTTAVRYAEPPRKKRRVDPTILRIRVERKIGKHEREIARIESEPRQLVPILEYQLPNSVRRELEARPGRTLEDVGINQGAVKAAQRMWNLYRLEQSRMERNSVRKIERAQNRALDTLKQLNEDLYNKTLEVDEITLIPYTSNHVRKETGPNPSYTPPDGYLKDITKEWVM